MSRSLTLPNCVLFAAALLLCGFPAFAGEQPADRTPEKVLAPIPRVIRYALLVRNPTDKIVRAGSVDVYAPLREGASHRLVSLHATTAHSISYDELNNAIVHLKVAELGPHATLAIGIEAVVEIHASHGGVEGIEPSRYLLPDELVQSNDPAIAALAQQLRMRSDLESVLAVYEWVASSVRYGGYALEAKSALRTLQDREGDCTEYAHLVAALVRSLGIPARVVGGFVLDDNPRFRMREQHDWAEIYVNGRWWIADSQRRVFGAPNGPQYLGFRVSSPRSRLTPELQRFSVSAPLLVEAQ